MLIPTIKGSTGQKISIFTVQSKGSMGYQRTLKDYSGFYQDVELDRSRSVRLIMFTHVFMIMFFFFLSNIQLELVDGLNPGVLVV